MNAVKKIDNKTITIKQEKETITKNFQMDSSQMETNDLDSFIIQAELMRMRGEMTIHQLWGLMESAGFSKEDMDEIYIYQKSRKELLAMEAILPSLLDVNGMEKDDLKRMMDDLERMGKLSFMDDLTEYDAIRWFESFTEIHPVPQKESLKEYCDKNNIYLKPSIFEL